MTIKISELIYDGVSFSLSTRSPVEPQTHWISGNAFAFMPKFNIDTFGQFCNFWSNLENGFFTSRDHNMLRELAQTMPGIPAIGTKTTSFYERNTVNKPDGTVFSSSQTRTRDFFNIPLTLIVAFASVAIAYSPQRNESTQEILQGSYVPVFLSELCKKVRNTHTTKVVVKVCGIEVPFDDETLAFLDGTFLDPSFITSKNGLVLFISLCNRLAGNPGNYIKMVQITTSNLRLVIPQLDGGHQNTYGALNSHKISDSNILSKIVELRPNNAFGALIPDVHFLDSFVFGQVIWLGPDRSLQLPRVKENFHAFIEFPTDSDCVIWIIKRVTGQILNGRQPVTADVTTSTISSSRRASDSLSASSSQILSMLQLPTGIAAKRLARILTAIVRYLNTSGGTPALS